MLNESDFSHIFMYYFRVNKQALFKPVVYTHILCGSDAKSIDCHLKPFIEKNTDVPPALVALRPHFTLHCHIVAVLIYDLNQNQADIYL